MRGRKPKPTALKLVDGNPGQRRINKNEPKPDPTMPTCPSHLSDVAKVEWNRSSKILHKSGLLTIIDRSALAAYCQAFGRWVEAEENLKKYGTIIRSPNDYPMQSPYLAIANTAMKQMKDFAALFGMSPSDRAHHLSVVGGKNESLKDRIKGYRKKE